MGPATNPSTMTTPAWQRTSLLLLAALAFAFGGFGGFGGLLGIGEKWLRADYSHGFLVVPFALYLAWRNRHFVPPALHWPTWDGLPLVLGSLSIYFVETKINVAKEWIQGACFLLALLGVAATLGRNAVRSKVSYRLASDMLCWLPLVAVPFALLQLAAPKVLIEGLPGSKYSMAFYAAFAGVVLGAVGLYLRRPDSIRWLLPALAMLALALPLPDTIENTLGFKLREIATTTAMIAFRTLGFTAHAPTPVFLVVGGVPLSVEAACSGISMLLAFVALTAGIAFLCPPSRAKSDRAIVLLSAIPIAVFCNILRIILSGLVLLAGWKQAFDFIVHDFAGWLMMPLALGIIWLEFKLLDWLFVPVQYLSREEVARAAFAEARAEMGRQQAERKALQETMAHRSERSGRHAEPHPAAQFLPLTPAGTSHGATAAGGTIAPPTQSDTPPPPGGGAP